MSATVEEGRTTVDQIREVVADSRCRIQLHDVVAQITSKALDELQHDRFSVKAAKYDAETVESRLNEYKAVVQDVLAAAILIARWGAPVNLPTLQRVLREFGEYASSNDGVVGWKIVRWTPFFSVLYASGIAALLGDRPEMLAGVFATRRGVRNRSDESATVVCHAIDSVKHGWSDTFRQLSAYERQYVAASNYMFDHVRPMLDVLVHAGSAYDDAFDRFEILNALTYASAQQEHGFWGPPGRFAWHYRNGGSQAYRDLQREAETFGAGWPIVASGMFGGNTETFLAVAQRYRDFMNHLGWH